ncbi:MAG: TonB-dependent receptor [Bacillota bacterium]|nr:TonB-dependent receptor [Bacillota bacterium]
MTNFKLSQRLLSVFVLSSIAILSNARGQSTYGSIVGTVKDATGALVSGAQVLLTNTGTGAVYNASTDEEGSYAIVNLNAGRYEIVLMATGFEQVKFSDVDLQARETKRVDATLHPGASSETVVVQGASTGVITTDVSNIAATKTGRELVDLPVAIYSRSAGSTSPISTLTTEPGVQTDSSGGLAIAGTTPALMSYTIDGISSVNVETSGPINELFPSFNSISEIRVSENNNNAEFSGVADVTTTSRSGTNDDHGGIFENHENTILEAGNPFVATKPKLIMNDFGGFAGGPLSFPKLYDGHNRTFFFASYEGLRLPKEDPIVTSVPSNEMRAGNLCDYLSSQGIAQVYEPDGVTPIPCSTVPVSTVAAQAMKLLMPVANTGDAAAYQKNYRTNFPTPVSSNQGDLRLDQTISSRQSIFARFTFKNRQVTTAPVVDCQGFCATAGSLATRAFSQPETDQGVTAAYNDTFTPALLNELRAGFNGMHTRTSMNTGLTSAEYLKSVGITGIPQPDEIPEVPNLTITGFMPTGGGNPSLQRSNIVQVLDNLTWTKHGHTFKFGGEFRRLTDHDDNVFGSWRSGQYVFDGSSNVGQAIGDPFTSFLLGYPDYTILAQVNNPAMNGLGHSYAFFAQDDWKITPSLTINYGLRWELHPPLKDTSYNTAAFLPDYFQNGVHGAVVVPNEKALSYTQPGFAASIAPTPILTAKQAGIPETLRYTDKTDFGPRIGFAWRPHGNDRMVVRGGWGRFIEQPLGFSLVSGWAVSASYVAYYGQDYDGSGHPSLAFPSPFPANLNQPGGASFQYAFPIHYKDPTVEQWNLTVEQDLGHSIGLRLSYTGSHGANLETMVDLNQVPANTVGYAVAGAQRPYPLWGFIQSVINGAESNYNAATVSVERHFSNGLQFQSSYVWTRDLSNAAGANPTAFAGAGGNMASDRFHLGLDYGNVAYDRRHRFLTTYLYELPFGKNKPFLHQSGIVRGLAGGWQWGGVVILQSGPFLTPYQVTTDPAGTNMLTNVGYTRANLVPNVPMYLHHVTTAEGDPAYLNPDAFADPPNNSGTFGNAAVGSVIGLGTEAVAMSLMKSVSVREKTTVQFGAEVSNLFNHRNYDVPDMNVDDGPGAFGVITSLQTAEGAGPRIVQLSARVNF